MKLSVLMLSLLLPFSYAEASAVRGCEIDAKVLRMNVDTSSGKSEVTLDLETTKSRPTGHSAGEAECNKPGTTFTFAVDNDDELLAAQVAVGDEITVEDITIYNVDTSGPSVFYQHKYLRTISSSLKEPPPAITTPQTITPKPARAGGCQLDPETSASGVALLLGALSLLLRRRP